MIHFNRNRRVQVLLALAVIAIAVSACAKSPGQSSEAGSLEICKRVVVLPFVDLSTIFGTNTSVRGPLTQKVFVTDEIAPQGELFMTKKLRQLLRAESSVEWLTASVQDGPHLPTFNSRPKLIRSLQSIGRRHKSDGVLIGFLYAFRERKGASLGVDSPAHVSFEIVLVSVTSGRLLWQPKFSETQEPLNENLFELGKFIRRKGRWITARDMAEQALKDILRTYPKPTLPSETK
jgi:hypothetical protein